MNDFTLPISREELYPLALRAARGDHNLAEDALQELWVCFRRGTYDPARPFLPWATTVIRRFCYDDFRFHIRTRSGTDLFPSRAACSTDFSDHECALDLTTPFCPDDQRAVLTWKPRPRLVILGWSGLWGKLTPEDQAATLDAVKLAVPFPVPDFLDWPEKDRTHYLSLELSLPSKTIAKIRERGLPRLRTLRFVRELREM